MLLKAIIPPAVGILLACIKAAAAVQAGCAGPDDMRGADCRNWITSSKTIFAAHDGKLYRAHFNSMQPEVLVDHGFSSVDFSLSSDGRHLSYIGQSGAHFAACVYDIENGKDHLLPVADARLLQRTFSPDGTRLAWADLPQQAARQNIMIMNLADGSIQAIRHPPDLRLPANDRMTLVHWTADGRQLLVGSIAYPKGVYFRISLPALTIAPIDGRYVPYGKGSDRADEGLHFSVDGHELAYYREPCLQSQCGNQGRPAPGESVQIDRNYRMTVTRPDGVEQVVARGGCDACGGASVKVLSWLEGGKYLVYEYKSAAYVYGIAEGKTSRLFDPGWQFGWQDNESRAPSPFP